MGIVLRVNLPKSRSFDSAEVRFAQDDRSFVKRDIEDKMLEPEIILKRLRHD